MTGNTDQDREMRKRYREAAKRATWGKWFVYADPHNSFENVALGADAAVALVYEEVVVPLAQRLAEAEQDFPRFLMQIGDARCWLTAQQAGEALAHVAKAHYGDYERVGKAMDRDGVEREMTRIERRDIEQITRTILFRETSPK